MTWFLPDDSQSRAPDRPVQDVPTLDWWGQAATQAARDRMPSQTGGLAWAGQDPTMQLLAEVEGQAGIDGALPASIASNPRGMAQAVDWRKSRLFYAISTARKADPRAYPGLPGSQEEFDTLLTQRTKERKDELDKTLAGQPQPSWTASIAGSLYEFTTRPSTVLTLPLTLFSSPAGGLARFGATEAGIGLLQGGAEVSDQHSFAKVTGDAPPTLGEDLATLAENAGMNAALGVGLHLLGRGVAKLVGGAVTAAERGAAHAAARDKLTGEKAPKAFSPAQADAAIKAGEASLGGDGAGPPPPAGGALPEVAADAPAGWSEIRNGIFAGESGGDYDALFGFQNRKGGVFADVKLTEMTVDQALAFADPQGRYGQWVASHNGGTVATPMGAYQIVGSTLRAAKEALGLTGDEVMTPQLQERIAQWIYREQGTGAWAGYRGPRDTFTPSGTDGAAPAVPYRTSRGYTGEGQIAAVGQTPAIQVTYEVVDASSLTRASGDLQPRDRTRATSDAQVADIAAGLDPARLMPGPLAQHGPPIVGPDGVIESGNGRVMAIERAAEQHPDRFQAYRDQIEAVGYTIPPDVKTPILIARRQTEFTPEARQRAVQDWNSETIATMSPTEQARVTADRMTPETMGLLDLAKPLGDPANGPFLRRVLDRIPAAARAAMFEASGALNRLGLMNIKAALFARAWPDLDILARYAETDAGELRSLLDALEIAAPHEAALKADIEAGRVAPQMDIGAHVLEAMRFIAAARDEAAGLARPATQEAGGVVDLTQAPPPKPSYVAQVLDAMLATPDLLDGPVSPLTEALARKFLPNGRAAPAKEIGAFLARYAEEARKSGASGDMFAASPREILARLDAQTFGSLPEDLGAARPVVLRGEDGRRVVTPGAMGKGAASPEIEAADAALKESLGPEADPTTEPGSLNELKALVQAGAPRAEIDSHPVVVKAIQDMEARPRTDQAPGYGSEEWHRARTYSIDGAAVQGTVDALPAWEAQADALAWNELGRTPEPVAHDREVVILLGPPAAGKSTIANEIAVARKAAILDSDEIKKSIPEFDGGIGAMAVHEESSTLAKMLQERMIARGKNIVLPKVGENAASIEKTIALYRKGGYRVSIVNMAVSPEVAYRRMIGRFAATGRLIDPRYMDMVGDNPSRTYRALKAQGVADGYAEIDNGGAFGAPKPVLDRTGENPLRGSVLDGAEGSRAQGNDGGALQQVGEQRPGPDAGGAGDRGGIPGETPRPSGNDGGALQPGGEQRPGTAGLAEGLPGQSSVRPQGGLTASLRPGATHSIEALQADALAKINATQAPKTAAVADIVASLSPEKAAVLAEIRQKIANVPDRWGQERGALAWLSGRSDGILAATSKLDAKAMKAGEKLAREAELAATAANWRDLTIATSDLEPGVRLRDLMGDIDEDLRAVDVIESCNPKGGA